MLEDREQIRSLISTCLAWDRPRLERGERRLRRHAEGPGKEKLEARLEDDIAASREQCRVRAARAPSPTYDEELPIVAHREEIAALIRGSPVCIISGETGSGKSTQLPKICLGLGRGIQGAIGHTQPRRIAARTVAARIAAELGVPLGDVVGHKVRFEDRAGDDALIKVMTDGILLAELAADRWLRRYDTLIVDEAHERSLNIDFLLGYLPRVLARRPELKLIITSATMNIERLSEHFDAAPVLEVGGRSYPVEVEHRAPAGEEPEDERAVVEAIESLIGGPKGDILAFLSGEAKIRAVMRRLQKARDDVLCLALYARLSAEAQDRVFAAADRQKVILATNVAETSLTIPGIGYVLDSGLARISRYSYRSKIQRLPVEPISRASAEQRKGRCGRVGPGVCVRLYHEEDLATRAAFTEPEIQRTNLASVILQMKALGLGEVRTFPFVDAPDAKLIGDGERLLREIGALDAEGELTAIGRTLARLPLDPRLGRMVLAAAGEGSLGEVLIIAAALSTQDPFERPREAPSSVTERRAALIDRRSDFMSYLRLWRAFHARAEVGSKGELRRWCQERYLSLPRVREWQEVHRQLTRLARRAGLVCNDAEAGYGAIHRAMLAGSLGLLGRLDDDGTYLGARGARFSISPASALHGKSVKWVMAAELVETRRVYAHRAAGIRPQWVERYAPAHLLSRSHHDPYFDARRSRVFAYEKVSLYGLPVVSGRRVPYDAVDPQSARQIFISRGLVEGRLATAGDFQAHNRTLIGNLRELEHRTRRADVLIDDGAIADLYAQRIPHEVCRGSHFERWRERAEEVSPRCLHLSPEELTQPSAPRRDASLYPDALEVDGHRFPLRYLFDPGHERDGVTITIPAALLNQLPPAVFEWLVPGMLPEKVHALLRTLPKSIRRRFVPLPETAEACLGGLVPYRGTLTDALSEKLAGLAGVRVPREAWKPEKLPAHLHMLYELVGGNLEVLARGRHLRALQARFAGEGEQGFEALRPASFERPGLTDWSFGDLEYSVRFRRAGLYIKGYPALVDAGDSVTLTMLDTPRKAREATRGGLRRLLVLHLGRTLKQLRRDLPEIERLCLLYATVQAPSPRAEAARGAPPVAGCEALKEDLLEAVLRACFLAHCDGIRTRGAFEQWLEEGAARIPEVAERLCRLTLEILQVHHAAQLERGRFAGAGLAENLADVDSQLRHLVFQGFVALTPLERLAHVPRYLRGVAARLAKLRVAPHKDTRRMSRLEGLWARYLHAAARCPDESRATTALADIRWMLEELRIALFCQELGTDGAISAARIEERWAEVERAARRGAPERGPLRAASA